MSEIKWRVLQRHEGLTEWLVVVGANIIPKGDMFGDAAVECQGPNWPLTDKWWNVGDDHTPCPQLVIGPRSVSHEDAIAG